MSKSRDIKFIIDSLKQDIELDFFKGRKNNPFRVLISTVLSQRTKDANTLKASTNLFRHYDTPQKISKAPLKKIEMLIKPSGFYRVKARHIKEISKQVLEDFKGRVPESLKGLLSLKGVGQKTANCVLLYGFGKSCIPVDTHVHRISNRIGLVKTKTPLETEEELTKVIPKRYWQLVNELFVKFGQEICISRFPRCKSCRIIGVCDYKNSNE